MATTKLKCPKCGNSIGNNNSKEQSRTCLNCGYEARGTREIHTLLALNGKEIAEDYIKLGLTDTLAKWGISTTALYKLPEVRELKGKYSKLAHEKIIGLVPSLPSFSDNWSEPVQLKWLGIYETLLLKEK